MENMELLENILKEQMQQMRRILKKYNREQLLSKPVILKIERLEYHVGGTFIEDKENDLYIITINELMLNRYNNFRGLKRYHKNELRVIMRHELTHAWVKDRYGILIKDVQSDSSIIFLEALRMFNTRHNYKDEDVAFSQLGLYNQLGIKPIEYDTDNNETLFNNFVFLVSEYLKDLEKQYSTDLNKVEFELARSEEGAEKDFYYSCKTKVLKDNKLTNFNFKSVKIKLGFICFKEEETIDKVVKRALNSRLEQFEHYSDIVAYGSKKGVLGSVELTNVGTYGEKKIIYNNQY